MSTELKNKDYISILKFYKLNIPKSKRLLKQHAENILNDKLCRCIKKLEPDNEAKSIAICSKSIFGNKNLKRGTNKVAFPTILTENRENDGSTKSM